jgi:hypothetical protein
LTDADGRIPLVEFHRGCGIHDQQPRHRIDGVVKPAIDHVLDDLTDAGALMSYAGNAYNPPEARILAGNKVLAMLDVSAETRWKRPAGVTRAQVHATIACLDSQRWRSPRHYGSLVDLALPPGSPPLPERETPLEDDDVTARQKRLIEART